jgi:hypothetical protein
MIAVPQLGANMQDASALNIAVPQLDDQIQILQIFVMNLAAKYIFITKMKI